MTNYNKTLSEEQGGSGVFLRVGPSLQAAPQTLTVWSVALHGQEDLWDDLYKTFPAAINRACVCLSETSWRPWSHPRNRGNLKLPARLSKWQQQHQSAHLETLLAPSWCPLLLCVDLWHMRQIPGAPADKDGRIQSEIRWTKTLQYWEDSPTVTDTRSQEPLTDNLSYSVWKGVIKSCS